MKFYSNAKQREGRAVREDSIETALNMHLYYEEKYYALLMVLYDDDGRHSKLIDGIQKKSEYWRDIYERLLL